MNIISNDIERGFYYLIPAGKPLSLQSLDRPDLDDRIRVFQKKNPAHLCFYYACNHIRKRYGKSCDEGAFAEFRKIERIGSEWKKALHLDCEYVMTYLNISFDNPNFSHSLAEMSASTHALFAKRLGYDIDQLTKSMFSHTKSDYENKASVDHFHSKYKPFYHIAACKLYAQSIGLTLSNWHPDQSFIEFKKCLLDKGPMVISGLFGRPFYFTDPVRLYFLKTKDATEKPGLNALEILHWMTPGYKEKSEYAHAITVIGAYDDYIYYLDPNDESHPNIPRRAYAVFYEDFCSRVCNLNGRLWDGESTHVGYGWQKD